jgi:hypothetical protein
MLEMYDQAVRTRPGGEMGEYLLRKDLPDREFILSRIGGTGREIIDGPAGGASSLAEPAGESRGRRRKAGGRRRWQEWKRALVLNREERTAIALGLFRLGGEVHQWMYDEWSLGELLRNAGFPSVRRCTAAESGIPGWAGFRLDVDPDGMEHAPNSLYMEGTRS